VVESIASSRARLCAISRGVQPDSVSITARTRPGPCGGAPPLRGPVFQRRRGRFMAGRLRPAKEDSAGRRWLRGFCVANLLTFGQTAGAGSGYKEVRPLLSSISWQFERSPAGGKGLTLPNQSRLARGASLPGHCPWASRPGLPCVCASVRIRSNLVPVIRVANALGELRNRLALDTQT